MNKTDGDLTLHHTTLNKTGGISATVGIWSGTTDALSLPAGRFVPGLHSILGEPNFQFGATTPFTDGEMPDSYVRMAWDTGGAAWDIGVIDAHSEEINPATQTAYGISSPEADALGDEFIDSLQRQIVRAHTEGKLYREDVVIAAINLGGNALSANEGSFAEDTGDTSATREVVSHSIHTTSNSIPDFVTPQTVFQTARIGPATGDDAGKINLSFPELPNGNYTVELFFAEISNNDLTSERYFDVVIEGKTLLNDYNIYRDSAQMFPSVQNSNFQIGYLGGGTLSAAIVRRFEVNVSDADGDAGLQVSLASEHYKALLNGIRILELDPPRVENVVLKGSSWATGVDYSYAEAVFAGNQLRPMYRTGADRIEIQFDSSVDITGATFAIRTNNGQYINPSGSPTYNAISNVATWSLSSPLPYGKYVIELTGVTGSNGALLDGDWDNRFGTDAIDMPTPDDFSDDPAGRMLRSGNGIAGGAFNFFFSVLPGDYNQDGLVLNANNTVGNLSDLAELKDGNGDGVIDGDDDDLVDTAIASLHIALPGNFRRGDFDDDEIVTRADYMIWKDNFGQVIPDSMGRWADANGNGIIDAADYTIWRAELDNLTSWYTGLMPSMGSGSSLPTVLFGVGPQVTGVTISGSNSTHDAYSFENIVGSGDQLMTVPVGGADTISITFSEDVNLVASDVVVVGLRTANRPALVDFIYDIGTQTATWRFDDMVANDHYLISLSDGVTDVEGIALDGEWINPVSVSTTNSLVSEFPSGNGTAGGDFNFVFTLLAGDYTLDNVVGSLDDDEFWMYYYVATTQFVHADSDGDGMGGTDDDYDLFLEAYGINLQELSVLADLNDDGTVDEDDFDILFDNWDAELMNPTLADGDLNGDGVIDLDDLDLMFAQYGLALEVVS